MSIRTLAGNLKPLDCDAINLGLGTIFYSLPKQFCRILPTSCRRLVEAAFSVFDKDGDGKVCDVIFSVCQVFV